MAGVPSWAVYCIAVAFGSAFFIPGVYMLVELCVNVGQAYNSVDGHCTIPPQATIVENGQGGSYSGPGSGAWTEVPCRLSQLQVAYRGRNISAGGQPVWLTFQQMGKCGGLSGEKCDGLLSFLNGVFGCTKCEHCSDFVPQYAEKVDGFDCNFELADDMGMLKGGSVQLRHKGKAKQSSSVLGFIGPGFTLVGLWIIGSVVHEVYREHCKRESDPTLEHQSDDESQVE